MRIFFLAGLLFALYSCNNDLNTIGDTMIPAESFVSIESYDITETSTIQLETFPTSLNVLEQILNSNQLILGKILDRTTGTMTATPYFQITGSELAGTPNHDDNYVYDSLTMPFPFDYKTANILAGDTTTFQTFNVYRLTDYPRFDYDDPCIYNNFDLPYDKNKSLGTLRIKLEKEALQSQNTYFKLSDELGRELFKLMLAKDSILYYPLDFIRYFNGLTIVPDENNTILFPITSSSLALQCHFHLNTGTYVYKFPAYGNYYAFTNLKHAPSSSLENVTWKTPKNFYDENMAVIQGLNGYMLKLKLPSIADVDPYKTILKAEIVLKPRVDNFENIPEPLKNPIQVFTLDKYSNISGILTDFSGNAVYGNLQTNPVYQEDRKYVIDITDYYNSVVSSAGQIDPEFNLLIGLRGTPLQIGTDEIKTLIGANNISFERLVIDEIPVLRIYYAKYK